MALPKYRPYIALASAALFVVLGILPASKVFASVDWNVIMMIAGTMGVVSLFIESKMPALLADLIIMKMPNVNGRLYPFPCSQALSPPLWTMWRRYLWLLPLL